MINLFLTYNYYFVSFSSSKLEFEFLLELLDQDKNFNEYKVFVGANLFNNRPFIHFLFAYSCHRSYVNSLEVGYSTV